MDPSQPAVDREHRVHLPVHNALDPGFGLRGRWAAGKRGLGEGQGPVVSRERDVLGAVGLGNTGCHHPVGEPGVPGRHR
jgi:hypothetical protein